MLRVARYGLKHYDDSNVCLNAMLAGDHGGDGACATLRLRPFLVLAPATGSERHSLSCAPDCPLGASVSALANWLHRGVADGSRPALVAPLPIRLDDLEREQW